MTVLERPSHSRKRALRPKLARFGHPPDASTTAEDEILSDDACIKSSC
jgi:hypothetical protein